MFNDGIVPDWEFEKLCKQFYPHYVSCYGMDKDLWKKFCELFAEEEEIKKDTTKSSTKKSTAPKGAKPVKSKNTHDNKNEWDDTVDFLKTLLDTLTGANEDVPKGKHEKTEPFKASPEVKKHIDDKAEVKSTDKPKTQPIKKEKKKVQTIALTLTDGTTLTLTDDNYDDYKLTNGCFIIMKNGEYVGIYNIQFIKSIIIQ